MRRSVALALLLVFALGFVSPAPIDPIGQVDGWADLWRPCTTTVRTIGDLGYNLAYDFSPYVQGSFHRGFAVLLPILQRVVDEPGFGDNVAGMHAMVQSQFSAALNGGQVVPYGYGAQSIWQRVEAAEAEGWRRSSVGQPIELWRVRLMDFLANAPKRSQWRQFGSYLFQPEPTCDWNTLNEPLPTDRLVIIPFSLVGASATATPTSPPAATVTSSPIVPPTATRNPTPLGLSCTPRPPVSVAAVPNGDGRLRVTLTTSTNPASLPNLLQALQVGALDNAVVELGGQVGVSGTVALPTTTSATLYVRRVNAGGAAHASLTIVDSCGAWPTFVGGGGGAF